jgi:hypothetical protein
VELAHADLPSKTIREKPLDGYPIATLIARAAGARPHKSRVAEGARPAPSAPLTSVLSGTAQCLIEPLVIGTSDGSLWPETDDAGGYHQGDGGGNHGPFDCLRIRAGKPHCTFLLAHRWILQDETPPVILIAGALDAANRRLVASQNAHAMYINGLPAQLLVWPEPCARTNPRNCLECIGRASRADRSSLKASKQLIERNDFFMSATLYLRCLRTSD